MLAVPTVVLGEHRGAGQVVDREQAGSAVSRTLPMNSGSVLSFQVSTTCGSRPDPRHRRLRQARLCGRRPGRPVVVLGLRPISVRPPRDQHLDPVVRDPRAAPGPGAWPSLSIRCPIARIAICGRTPATRQSLHACSVSEKDQRENLQTRHPASPKTREAFKDSRH
jgi:hypothetical protein